MSLPIWSFIYLFLFYFCSSLKLVNILILMEHPYCDTTGLKPSKCDTLKTCSLFSKKIIIISNSWLKLCISVADVILYILRLFLWDSNFASLSINLESAMGFSGYLLFLHFSHIWLMKLWVSEWSFGLLMPIITFPNKRGICWANNIFFSELQTNQK